jgi:hypothetical protein
LKLPEVISEQKKTEKKSEKNIFLGGQAEELREILGLFFFSKKQNFVRILNLLPSPPPSIK